MGLLMAGFMGGMGKGLADSSETAYKQAMDEKKIAGIQEFQTRRDDINNERSVEAATVADTRQVARDKTAFDNQLISVRETIKTQRVLAEQYGSEDIAAAQESIAKSNGNILEAIKIAKTPGASGVLHKMNDAINGNRTTESTLETQGVGRTVALGNLNNSNKAEERAAQTYIDDAKVPSAVKTSVATINKQIEIIATARAKAMADGSYNPNNASAQKQTEELTALGIRAQDLLKPYLKAGSADTVDIAGYDASKKKLPETLTEANSNGLGRTSAANERNVNAQELEVAIRQKDPRAIARITKNMERLDVIIANERGTKQPVRDVTTPAAPLITQMPQKNGLLSAVASTAGDYFSGMGTDYATPQGRAELVRRVAEANKGGQQLSSIERMRAQQAGLVK